MLAILEYKAGNQTSVKRALEYLGIPSLVTDRPEDLAKCHGVIFPGVGSAVSAMDELRLTGLDIAIKDLVERGQPLLGICLGCQILLRHSAEGPVETLGVVGGECRLFSSSEKDETGRFIKVPHMGWNQVRRTKEDPIWNGIPPEAEFYFVHSYYAAPESSLVLGVTTYGHDFCSAYGGNGLWAVQFHPEKSGRYGLRLLHNFNSYCESRAHAF